MTRAELRWAFGWALVVMLVTCLPYLYVATLAPPGTSFSGLLHWVDDHCVYLSWAQQGVRGRFFMSNLFTGDPQRAIYINPLGWLVGTVTRLSGLPLILVHHAARVLSGIVLLLLVYRLSTFFTSDRGIRRAAFWFTALSAGFGWLYPQTFSGGDPSGPVDIWQPEAITFLCLYVNGLFCVALSLMLGVLILLLGAEGETGRRRWGRVIGAGVMGLLLGNIHSYDVITLAGVWAAYLGARAVAERRFPGRSLVDALVAALIALPSTLHQYYLSRTDPVFQARSGVEMLSPPLLDYLLGYGLLLPLAVAGGAWLIRTARCDGQPLGRSLLPLTWAVVGFAIPYLPLAFQRRLIQGQHLPLALLAAVGAVTIARMIVVRKRTAPIRGKRARVAVCEEVVPPGIRVGQTAMVAGLLLLTMPTLWVFLQRDIQVAAAPKPNVSELPTFLSKEELQAMRWAREHLPEDGVVFCGNATGCLFPAFAGRAVYAGHWSETPDFRRRLFDTIAFYRSVDASPKARRDFLQARRVRYVYCGNRERRIGRVDLSRDPYLRPIYHNAGVTLYEVCPKEREEARERRSEGARERGSEGARERGSEGAREREGTTFLLSFPLSFAPSFPLSLFPSFPLSLAPSLPTRPGVRSPCRRRRSGRGGRRASRRRGDRAG